MATLVRIGGAIISLSSLAGAAIAVAAIPSTAAATGAADATAVLLIHLLPRVRGQKLLESFRDADVLQLKIERVYHIDKFTKDCLSVSKFVSSRRFRDKKLEVCASQLVYYKSNQLTIT